MYGFRSGDMRFEQPIGDVYPLMVYLFVVEGFGI
jgi:hypothetical protein